MTTSAPLVLHLAVEYPSRNRDTNTTAVRNFIQANPRVNYRVYALRRSANPWRCNALPGDDQGDPNVTSMRYWGLPYGIWLFISMTIVAWRIRRDLRRQQLKPTLVHAHKFSFEGIAGWWLAKWLQVPLALSVRGEAEQKTLTYKPHYRPLYRRILQRATRIYYVSAWFRPILNRHFALTDQQQQLLPNFVAERQWQPQLQFQANALVSVMDLNVLEKKGLPQLLDGFAYAKQQQPNLTLTIIGGGFDHNRNRAQQLIAQRHLTDSVTLLGSVDNQQLLQQLGQFAGLVLPSRNETFGMVYVEALLSGLPILYSKHTGIDGFIDNIEAAIGCDPQNSDSIGQAILTLLAQQHPWRRWLLRHHQQIHQRFARTTYIDNYNETFQLIRLPLVTVADIIASNQPSRAAKTSQQSLP
ncbi:glycosyltransferase [Ferrimonas senticii]|uniref:glycosyltransferase n=1 Tax=Ferrimonas senticii TaxID=394566 RepID=UPI0003F8A2A0|nr:glycosyltransferase [Ferrimonas senticii]